MNLYKIYVLQKTKSGELKKSIDLIVKAATIEEAETKAVKEAKEWYKFSGIITIGSKFIKQNNKWIKI